MAIISKLPGSEKVKEQEIKALDRLNQLYRDKKKKDGLNQTKLAELMGIKQQSAISQYLLGKIPLNVISVLNFAQALEVSPLEIYPELLQPVYDLFQTKN